MPTPNNALRNQTAIVSGSSMGIGKEIARQLLSMGVSVVLNGRDTDKLITTMQELSKISPSVCFFTADIQNENACRNLIDYTIEQYGRIDILINNAAVSSRGSLEDSVASNFKTLMDTNYTGAVYLSKFAIPYLRGTQGHIIFINSVGGFRGMPYNAAYTASKAAQAALAEALRIELKDANIHVGLIYVGFTENEPDKKILDEYGDWVYLPKRENVQLATRYSVAQHVIKMIIQRKNKMTLTPLGHFTSFMTRYLPKLSDLILTLGRNTLKKDYTDIGGEKSPVEHTFILTERER